MSVLIAIFVIHTAMKIWDNTAEEHRSEGLRHILILSTICIVLLSI